MSDIGWDEIIEPDGFEAFCANPRNGAIAVGLLTWLVESLKGDEAYEQLGAELEVVCVSYLGSYPAIGMRTEAGDSTPVAARIHTMIVYRLRNSSTLDFLDFFAKDGRNWQTVYDDLINRPQGL